MERAGNGPDLVLLHGWGLHSGVWAEAMVALGERYRIHAIDLPGHGHSSSAAVGSFDQCVDAIAALVPDGVAVCGWSLGGLLAQRLAARHPAKVRRLALVGSTPCFVERGDWRHAMKPATLEAFANGLQEARDETLASFVCLNALHGAHGRDAIRDFTRRLNERGEPSTAGLAASLRWLRDIDLRHAAATIAAPTLVIHGTRDALAPIAAGRWLAATIPVATLHEIPGAAHLPFFTHRDLFVQALESFVA